jgi:hypothetical protein
MIVKVQVSLGTTEDEQQVLIYNRKRSFETQLPITACPGLLDVMGDAPKAYFKAEIVDGKVHLNERVKEQNW